MMINLEKVNEIIVEAEAKKQEISTEKTWLLKAIDQAIDVLKTMPKLLESKEYNLVFMGKQGCGKTSTITAICDMMTDDINNVATKHVSKKNVAILPVGSGGTTMAESIEIIQSDVEESHIDVECSGRKELKEIVRSIVEKYYLAELYVYLKEQGNDDVSNVKQCTVSVESIPSEIERYVDGMCKKQINAILTPKTPKIGLRDIIKNKIHELIDSDMSLDWVENELEIVDSIVQYIMSELIILDNNCTEEGTYIVKIQLDNTDIKKDLRNKMTEINSGTLDGISIITRVSIYLHPDDIDFKIEDENGEYCINRIVDTRGYRSSEEGKKGVSDGVREDYQKYLCNEDGNSICIFEENYKDSSGGNLSTVSEMIEYNVKASYRVGLNAIIINWQTGEIYDNQDNQEYMDDYDEEGEEEILDENELVDKRINQIKDFFGSKGVQKDNAINFNTDNVFAYNALSGYSLQKIPGRGEIITDYDREVAEQNRKKIIDCLFKMVKRERRRIEESIQNNIDMLSNFVEFGSIAVDEIIGQILEDIHQYAMKKISLVGNEFKAVPFFGLYKEKISNFHSRAYKPLAMHKGAYVGIKYFSVFVIDDEMNKFYEKHINTFCNLMEEKFESVKKKCEGAQNMRRIQTLLDNIMERMKTRLEECSRDIVDSFCNLIKEDRYFGSVSQVWDTAICRANSGGKGVNADIKNILLDSIDPEQPHESLYGTFYERCMKIQEKINDQLLIIIRDCFYTVPV